MFKKKGKSKMNTHNLKHILHITTYRNLHPTKEYLRKGVPLCIFSCPVEFSLVSLLVFQFIWVSICIYAIIYRRNKGVLEEFRLWIEWVLYGTEGMNTRYVRNQQAVHNHLISTKTQAKSLLFSLSYFKIPFSPRFSPHRTWQELYSAALNTTVFLLFNFKSH